MEIQTALPVQFTQPAVQELQRLMAENTDPVKNKLRVGVKGGGCSGMTYVLEFDSVTDKDKSFMVDGVECIMDASHELYLHGMEIDWEGGLNSRGFTFKNPNASTTCGCGTSFAV